MSDELKVNEPEDAGEDHEVPVDLTVLHEVLEWKDHLKKKAEETRTLLRNDDNASN